MNFITTFFSAELINAIGWTLFHSLWQAAVVAILLGGLMIIMRRFTSHTRYKIEVGALFFMLTISVITFIHSYQSETKVTIVPLQSTSSENVQQVNNFLENNTGSAGQIDNQNWMKRVITFFTNYFQRNFPLMVTLWLMGILIYLLKFMGGFAYSQRLKVHKTNQISQEWERRFTELIENMAIRKSIRLMESAIVKAPLVIGHFKPMVLIPVGMLTGMPHKQVEAVLVHELAHILRKDYLINIFQSLIDIIYFYHPGIRWISAHIRSEREHCCDDIALSVFGDSLSFAKALASLQASDFHQPELAMAATGKNGKLYHRIKRLIGQPRINTNFSEGFIAACILFVVLLTISVSVNAAVDWNVEEFATQIAETDSGEEKLFDEKTKMDFNRFEILKSTRMVIGGETSVKKGKRPLLQSWIINDETGEVVWNLLPSHIQQKNKSLSFKQTVRLKKGKYKWYFPLTGITYSKVAEDDKSVLKSIDKIESVENVDDEVSVTEVEDDEVSSVDTEVEESIENHESSISVSSIRKLDFQYRWKGKQRRIRAEINHGHVTGFILDNATFLKNDINKNWDFIVKILSDYEGNRYVYKRPKKRLAGAAVESIKTLAGNLGLWVSGKEGKALPALPALSARSESGAEKSSLQMYNDGNSIDDRVKIMLRLGAPYGLLVELGKISDDRVQPVRQKIYDIMVKNTDRYSKYGRINNTISVENDSSQLSVLFKGIEKHKINFIRSKIYHILLQEEIQLKSVIVKE